MVLKGQGDFGATACGFLSRGKTGPADPLTFHRLAGSRRFALLQFGIVMEGGVRQARILNISSPTPYLYFALRSCAESAGAPYAPPNKLLLLGVFT